MNVPPQVWFTTLVQYSPEAQTHDRLVLIEANRIRSSSVKDVHSIKLLLFAIGIVKCVCLRPLAMMPDGAESQHQVCLSASLIAIFFRCSPTV